MLGMGGALSVRRGSKGMSLVPTWPWTFLESLGTRYDWGRPRKSCCQILLWCSFGAAMVLATLISVFAPSFLAAVSPPSARRTLPVICPSSTIPLALFTERQVKSPTKQHSTGRAICTEKDEITGLQGKRSRETCLCLSCWEGCRKNHKRLQRS